MKRLDLSNVPMPDLPEVSGPDMGSISDSLLDLAETAADAISSAAGHVPGLDDYRASTRRRNMFMTVGAITAVLVLVAYLKRRASQNDVSTAQGSR